jgi:hypothetical protein
MRSISSLLALVLTCCVFGEPVTPSTEQSPSEKLRLVAVDLHASGRDGAAAIVTESKTQNWIQFFLIAKENLHFDLPNHIIQPPGFSLAGPWERVARIPELPYPTKEAQFSDVQVENLKRVLAKRGIKYFYHRQAIFDQKRRPLAATEDLQFEIPCSTSGSADLILDVFGVLYGHRPASIEVERLQLDLD